MHSVFKITLLRRTDEGICPYLCTISFVSVRDSLPKEGVGRFYERLSLM